MEQEPWSDVLIAIGPSILVHSGKIGAASGILGLCIGGVAGTIRRSTPLLFAIGSGLQCGAIGASWSSTRWIADVYQARQYGIDVSLLNDSQRTTSHTVAGAFSGGLVAALFRGRANILPGMAVFGLCGYLGSTIQNRYLNSEDKAELPEHSPSLTYRALHSRYNPMKAISDKQYEEMLQEKLIRVEAEISLVDDSIEKLKNSISNPPTSDSN